MRSNDSQEVCGKMKKTALIVIVLFWSAYVHVDAQEEIQFPDTHMENALRMELGKAEGEPLYKTDLQRIWNLDLSNSRIESIEGLEYCTHLYYLHLDNNALTDITPLAGLTRLVELSLEGNTITDISPLASLTNIEFLYLSGNTIADISPLSSLTTLTVLSLSYNSISDISPLFNLTNLSELYLANNAVTDIFPLSNLTALTVLDLGSNNIQNIIPLFNMKDLRVVDLRRNAIKGVTELRELERIGEYEGEWIGAELNISYNEIADITPLIDNPGISKGDSIDISNNPLNSYSIERCIPRLRKRGVELRWEPVKDTTHSSPSRELLSPEIFLVLLLAFSLLLYGYVRKKRSEKRVKKDQEPDRDGIFSDLKSLLEERTRLTGVLNELESKKPGENYRKMHNHVVDRLLRIERSIEKKRKEISEID
jgi:internalin A